MVDKFNVVWLALTYNCNNRCSWCYSSSNDSRPKESLQKDKISPLLDLLTDLGIKRTILIGGEPSIYPNLLELLEEHQQRKIPTGMVTNGRKFSDDNFAYQVRKEGLKEITVSIEGYDSQSHNSVTNVQESYEEALQGIRNAGKLGMKVQVNTVITKHNSGSLEKFVDSLIDEPIEGFSFNICGPCLTNNQNNSSLLSPYFAAQSFAKIYEYIISKGKTARLVTPTPLCFFEEDFRKKLREKNKISGGPCQLSHGKNFVVEPNGTVVPCTHMAGFPMLDLFQRGEIISRKTFLEKYNSPSEIPFNFRKKMSRNASKKCDEPSCSEPCSGGCPLYWYSFDPEKEIKGTKPFN